MDSPIWHIDLVKTQVNSSPDCKNSSTSSTRIMHLTLLNQNDQHSFRLVITLKMLLPNIPMTTSRPTINFYWLKSPRLLLQRTCESFYPTSTKPGANNHGNWPRGPGSYRGNSNSWPMQTQESNASRNGKFCFYCKILNHTQEECQKRMKENKACINTKGQQHQNK